MGTKVRIDWFDRSFETSNHLMRSMLGYLNDLWRYRVSDKSWTWMSGSNIVDQVGVYGEKGVADESNVPGSRQGAAGWFDSSTQELWLFGGHRYSGTAQYYNDMWVYQVNNATWTWMAGSNMVNHMGAYGEKGEASADYIPHSREGFAWYDSSTREVWLFGGAYDCT